MLTLAVVAVLYGLYRGCRTTLAELRGEAAPAPLPNSLKWRRLLLQPHQLQAPAERHAADTAAAAAARQQLQASEQRLAALQATLDRRDERIVSLQSRVQMLEREAQANDRRLADPFDPVPGKDDLRVIRGIGKRMQRLLNELGVTTLAQLAALERSHIDRVAARLEGSGHDIDAENWVGQARQLLARRRRTHEQG